jgi:hypothetical protein
MSPKSGNLCATEEFMLVFSCKLNNCIDLTKTLTILAHLEVKAFFFLKNGSDVRNWT